MWQISIDKMSAMPYIIRNRCGLRPCVGVMFVCQFGAYFAFCSDIRWL